MVKTNLEMKSSQKLFIIETKMDLYELSTAQSLANLHYNFSSIKAPYLKPIGFSTPSHFHRRSKRSAFSHVTSHGEMPHSPRGGIIFEWPQRRKFYSEKELCFMGWIIAHALYWLHIIHIFPTGTGSLLFLPFLYFIRFIIFMCIDKAQRYVILITKDVHIN